MDTATPPAPCTSRRACFRSWITRTSPNTTTPSSVSVVLAATGPRLHATRNKRPAPACTRADKDDRLNIIMEYASKGNVAQLVKVWIWHRLTRRTRPDWHSQPSAAATRRVCSGAAARLGCRRATEARACPRIRCGGSCCRCAWHARLAVAAHLARSSAGAHAGSLRAGAGNLEPGQPGGLRARALPAPSHRQGRAGQRGMGRRVRSSGGPWWQAGGPYGLAGGFCCPSCPIRNSHVCGLCAELARAQLHARQEDHPPGHQVAQPLHRRQRQHQGAGRAVHAAPGPARHAPLSMVAAPPVPRARAQGDKSVQTPRPHSNGRAGVRRPARPHVGASSPPRLPCTCERALERRSATWALRGR